MLKEYIENNVRNIVEYALIILAVFIIYFVTQIFFIKTVNVSGNSMEPTMFHGDRLIITRFSYFFEKPQYNDIVAFPFKNDKNSIFIKRVIGMPGDVVDLQAHRFVINGNVLEDTFSEEMINAEGNIEFPVVVPDDSYFVLGDNRNVSKDSRYTEVGCILRKDIIGKAYLRILPIKRFGFL